MSERKMGFHAMPGYYRSKAIQTTVLDIQINKYAKMFTESSTEAKKLFRYLRRTITELSASRIDNNVIDCCDILINYLKIGVRYEFFMELESKRLSITETIEALNKQALKIRKEATERILFVSADEDLRNRFINERGNKIMKKLSKAEKMQFETMKEHRNMPFIEIGMRVEACGGYGEIVGAINGNLGIKFDGKKRVSNCHPTYNIKYFSKSGEVIAEYGK